MATLLEQIQNKKKLIEKKAALIEKKQSWIKKKQSEIDDLNNGLVDQEREWLRYDIKSLEDDIRRANNEIAEANKRIEELNTKQKILDEKAANRNIKPILEFLEKYKELVIEYYEKGIKEYYEAKKEYYDYCKSLGYFLSEAEQAKKEELLVKFNKVRGWTDYNVPNPDYNPNIKWSSKTMKVHYDGTAEYAERFYKPENDYIGAMNRLTNEIKKDCENKYDRLVDEVMYYTGKITDASHLRVNAKGELDGYVIGEKGKARVHTEGAAGYNIQRFHYRTYVNVLKDM